MNKRIKDEEILNRDKVPLNLRVDKENLEEFKVTMKNLKMTISSFLDEMMKRVVEIDKSPSGGEVAFGLIPKGYTKKAFVRRLFNEEENKSKEKSKK